MVKTSATVTVVRAIMVQNQLFSRLKKYFPRNVVGFFSERVIVPFFHSV